MISSILITYCRLAVRMLIVSFYPRAIEKTSLIYQSLSKKDLKYTSCLIIMRFIVSPLIRDSGFTQWGCGSLNFSSLLVKRNVYCTSSFSNAAGNHPSPSSPFLKEFFKELLKKILALAQKVQKFKFSEDTFEMLINKAGGSAFRQSNPPLPRIILFLFTCTYLWWNLMNLVVVRAALDDCHKLGPNTHVTELLFVIHANLPQSKPSLFRFGLSSPLWWFSIILKVSFKEFCSS